MDLGTSNGSRQGSELNHPKRTSAATNRNKRGAVSGSDLRLFIGPACACPAPLRRRLGVVASALRGCTRVLSRVSCRSSRIKSLPSPRLISHLSSVNTSYLSLSSLSSLSTLSTSNRLHTRHGESRPRRVYLHALRAYDRISDLHYHGRTGLYQGQLQHIE
jgi:hypothetical protein